MVLFFGVKIVDEIFATICRKCTNMICKQRPQIAMHKSDSLVFSFGGT
jgi:hypothetical protein